jgi:hypothetical protein
MKENEKLYFTGENSLSAYASQTVDHTDSNIASKARSRTFDNFSPNMSVKSDYNRGDFEYFRPSYRVPQRQSEIIAMCMEAYQKVGLVRNVIDLMGDFGAQGIRLQHSLPITQEFYNSWWKKIDGPSVSERFLNLLYRAGQTIVKASNGKVTIGDEKKWKKSKAEDIKIDRIKTVSREIPLMYSFIDMSSVEVLNADLVPFVGQPLLALKIGSRLKSIVRKVLQSGNNTPKEIKDIVDKIPKDILKAMKDGQSYVPLDSNKVSVYYYKKDDWMLWANPMCYAILDDLFMLNKLKLADMSALDGAISNIRLWTLGFIGDSPQNSVLPTRAAINKLRSILSNNVGGGVLELVWGPELKFTESNSQVWRFLGSEKYAATINAIYEGLGIPAPLRSGSGVSSTGNFIGLNTLIKRLQYGRDRLVDFWTKELKYIHKAMDFPGRPPQIVFDFMALADEAAEKQLLINLWDRDIISDETILELFGRLPHIEKSRVKREVKDRTEEHMPYKASPFHNPDKEHDYRKILLQGGGVAPSELGITLQPKKKGEKSRIDQMADVQTKMKNAENDYKKGNLDNTPKVGLPGRPKNITETSKRQSKPTERPSVKASFIDLFLWSNSAQEQVSDILTKPLLESLQKRNMRSLSHDEFDLVERIKLRVLCNIEPFSHINEYIVNDILIGKANINQLILQYIEILKNRFVSNNNRQPKIEELRQIYASAYSLYYEEQFGVN